MQWKINSIYITKFFISKGKIIFIFGDLKLVPKTLFTLARKWPRQIYSHFCPFLFVAFPFAPKGNLFIGPKRRNFRDKKRQRRQCMKKRTHIFFSHEINWIIFLWCYCSFFLNSERIWGCYDNFEGKFLIALSGLHLSPFASAAKMIGELSEWGDKG